VGPASMTRICHANRSLIREVCAGRATNLCLEEDDHAVPNDEARRCWQPPQTKASSSYPSRWGVSTYKRRKQLDSTRWSFLTRGGNVECHMSSAARCSTSPSIATSQRAKPCFLIEHDTLLPEEKSWNISQTELDCPTEGWQFLPNVLTEAVGLIQPRSPSPLEKRPEAICSTRRDVPNAAEAHGARSRISGTICLAVRYPKAKLIARDVPVLRIANGRIFVDDVDRNGLAWSHGVRNGDELVRVKVGAGSPFAPEVSTCALQRLAAEPSLATQSAVGFFMGFKGEMQAEVQVNGPNLGETEPCPTSLASLTGNSVFQVQDCATIMPNRGSILIASKVPAEKQNKQTIGSAGVAQSVVLRPRNEETWRLLEVERRQARLILESAKKAANAARDVPCISSFV